MATGANTTPLGRLNPSLVPGSKSGSSLLKPSYMIGSGSGGSMVGRGGGGPPPAPTSSSHHHHSSSSSSSAFAQSVAAAAAAAMALASQPHHQQHHHHHHQQQQQQSSHSTPPPPPSSNSAVSSSSSSSHFSMAMNMGVANAHFMANFHAPPPPPPPPPPHPPSMPPTPPIHHVPDAPAPPPVAIMVKREYDHDSNSNDSDADRKRRRRSRWASDDKDKAFIPGMPPVLPNNLSKSQEKAYLLQLQIEELSRRLRMGDLGIPPNPEERSPSPEPIYNNEGKRLNTREYRTRKKLEDERHHLIQQMIDVNPEFKPPADYKPPIVRVNDKVMIPQEEHPDINFVGLLIGPRGNTLKSMEKDTGAKIIIRGKGSVKEGKVSRKDGQLLPGEDEPLHAYVTANNPESVKKAVERIKEIIRQGVEVPEGQNDLRRMQLRELALLNGTLRENEGQRCSNCGASNHKSWQCPDKPNVTNNVICSSCGGVGHIAKDCRERRLGGGFAPGTGIAEKSKIDEEYMSLMAELGEGPPPPMKSSSGGMHSHASNLFSSNNNNQGVPRALMAPPPPSTVHGQAPPPALMSQSVQPPWNQGQVPPPGILSQPPPPPPVPGSQVSSPTAMSWMQQQPTGMGWQQQHPSPVPPPRAGSMESVSHWAHGFVGVAPPPPPPPPPSSSSSQMGGGGQSGVDLNALAQVGLPNLLAAPPPPPPPQG